MVLLLWARGGLVLGGSGWVVGAASVGLLAAVVLFERAKCNTKSMLNGSAMCEVEGGVQR